MNYDGNDKYGTLPRRTMIANQPHMLAYINPQEEMLLRRLGGTGQAGPMGVPAYPPGDGGFSPDGGGGYGGGGGFGGFGGSEGGGGGYNDAADAAAAMAAADAAIAGQMAAAAQEEENAAAMAEAEAAAVAIQDPSDIPTGSITTSIVGTPMFENMKNLMAQEEAKNNIGSSGYVSVDAIADTGIDPETNYGDANPNSPNAYFDAFGNAYNTAIEAEVADNVAAGYNDVPDMGGNTFEEYEAKYGTSPDFTNSGDFDPNEYIGGPGDGEGGETTTTTNTLPSSFDRVEYNYNTSLEASPYGGMWSNIASTVPKYEFNAYEDEDGLLRFSDNDEPVPPEILKYLSYAKKTLIEEETEEEETEEEAA